MLTQAEQPSKTVGNLYASVASFSEKAVKKHSFSGEKDREQVELTLNYENGEVKTVVLSPKGAEDAKTRIIELNPELGGKKSGQRKKSG